MTEQKLKELEARFEREYHEEQIRRMAIAMKAINEVAPQMCRISHVGLVAKWERNAKSS